MSTDIRKTHPYFRFKRGMLTLFISIRATEEIAAVKRLLIDALEEQGDEAVLSGLTPEGVQLLVEQSQAGAETQYRTLDNDTKVSASDMTDDQVVYFVFQNEDGTWEKPQAADLDADGLDMTG
ncbi:hypothetical protein GGF46_002320 [Coemansia sp. RSA 552]|nr:hypothetical protein GGF46_002320 [Coemansia sp. RSA 552]